MSFLAFNGGPGKTSVVINVAAAMAGRHTVAVIDLDPQGNASEGLPIEDEGTMTAAEVLKEAARNPRFKLHPSAFSTVRFEDGSGLYLLPTPDADELAEATELLALKDGSEYALKRALSGVRGVDGILVDTAPSISRLTANAVVASTVVFTIYTDQLWSAEGANAVEAYVQDLGAFTRTRTRFGGAIHNKARAKPNAIAREVAALMRASKMPILKTSIPASPALEEAEFTGLPVAVTSPRARITAEFDKLSREIWRKARV